MQSYQKRPLNRSEESPRTSPENPLVGGMPSLTEGASRKDLPEAMRTKMENAFGADFSNLNIVESEKVAEGGARAVTQGNTIAFAPGEFNVYSPSSEALLGHELSHVVSQARGESRGNGLLTDSYLEAKADREGVMAAAGQQVYSGPVTPLSNSSPMSVAGPMQCKKKSAAQEEISRDDAYRKAQSKVESQRKQARLNRGDVELLGEKPSYYLPQTGNFRYARATGRYFDSLFGRIGQKLKGKTSQETYQQQYQSLGQYGEHEDVIQDVEDLGGTVNTNQTALLGENFPDDSFDENSSDREEEEDILL